MISIPCLCACCADFPDGCSGETVLETGVAPDRCVMCEAGDGCAAGFVHESEALDRVNALRLAPEEHALAVDALGLRYRPGPKPDREHEGRLLALLGRG